jgi:hypothetical protein
MLTTDMSTSPLKAVTYLDCKVRRWAATEHLRMRNVPTAVRDVDQQRLRTESGRQVLVFNMSLLMSPLKAMAYLGCKLSCWAATACLQTCHKLQRP